MKKLAFLVFFMSLQISAQQFKVQKGVVIDDLKITDSLDNSFAIYLPRAFEYTKKWPVLFVFDGKGRGRAAAQILATVAEEQGYIIASSNSIDVNLSLEQNAMVGSRLMEGISKMLPVDLQQLSTIGSGVGAQVATSLPLIFDNILGTVAIGDQWINYDLLNRRNNFLFIGVVGDEQYSFRNMKDTKNMLSSMGLESGIYIYEGAQDWPTTAILNNAVGSLTLKAIRKNLRPKQSNLIEKLYADDLQLVNNFINRNNLLEADEILNFMQENYKGLVNFSEIKSKQKQLQQMPNYKLQETQGMRISEKEVSYTEDFFYFLNDDISNSNFENLSWWNYQKKQLDSLQAATPGQSKMVLRLEDFVKKYANLHLVELEKKHAPLESKLVANMILTIFDPQAFNAYKQIISLSAQDNDFQTAYFYLEEMLKHGYKDMDGLYSIEGTLGLRLTPEYNQIIENYLGISKFHDSGNE